MAVKLLSFIRFINFYKAQLVQHRQINHLRFSTEMLSSKFITAIDGFFAFSRLGVLLFLTLWRKSRTLR